MGVGNSTLIDGELSLRPAAAEDLDLLAAWFADPEVYGWWGGVPLSRETVAAKYTGARRPTVESLIVERSGRPIGYAQFHAENKRGGGLDMVLLPEFREQGIGSQAARLLVRHLRERLGWRRITVDPAVDNHRAIRAWEKGGFRAERVVPDGPEGPRLLMSQEDRAH